LDTTKWGSVSRHGLLQAGIMCPYCGHAAARTGEFHLVHLTRFGEGVHCQACGAVLLASPDDDVDPVKPGTAYDPTIYHVFAKPAQRRRIGQRITGAVPQIGDWIVIRTERLVELTFQPTNALALPPVNYFGVEGRVDRISPDGTYLIALSGNHGIGGAGSAPGSGIGGAWAEFSKDEIAVMVMPTFKAGDKVRIIQGDMTGQTGVLDRIKDGRAMLQGIAGYSSFELPMERIEKVIEHELVV